MRDHSPARTAAAPVAAVVLAILSLTLPQAALSTVSAQAQRRPATPIAASYYPDRFDWHKQTPEQAESWRLTEELGRSYLPIPGEIAAALQEERNQVDAVIADTKQVSDWLAERQQAARVAELYGK